MTTINPHIFRAYDIRGLAIGTPPDLTPHTIELIGKATGTYLKRQYQATNMLVGRDNRLHSEELQQAFIQGVLSTGINVDNAGISTSPLIYYGVCKFQYDSGVNITASHNPKEYNGVKIVGKNAHSICGDELQKILKLIQDKDFETAPHPGIEKPKTDNFETYLEDMTARFQLVNDPVGDPELVEGPPLKVVVDCGNATTGIFAPQLLKAIGCDVVELYCNLDGNFPNHEANPEDEKNMQDLAAKVRETKADLGIGYDGDGDRVGFVDENGKHYSADLLLLLLARELLAHKPKSQIVFDVKVSQILIDEITKADGIPVMCKTGHSFIETKMHETNAPLAGEISGHLFFGRTHYNYYGFDDAFFGTLQLLKIHAQANQAPSLTKATNPAEGPAMAAATTSAAPFPFSQHFAGLPTLATTPEFKAPCPDDKKFEIVKKLADHFTQKYECITLDGVRIQFDKQAWGAVRCSNTSPNLTLRFEAENPQKLQEIQKIMVEELKKYPEVSLNWYNPAP